MVALENTLDGTLMPIEEIRRIRKVCDTHGLFLHLDGARLWNASAATGIPMREYGRLFDTVSVCLSKGAGAPIGSILASSKERIRKARHLRKLMGGGWRQAGLLAAAARYCIDTVVPTMPETHKLAARLAENLQSMGVRLVLPCHTNMVFIDLAPVGITVAQLAAELKTKNIKINNSPGTTTRIVLHYQITPQAVEDFIDTTLKLIQQAKADGFVYSKETVQQQQQEKASVPDLSGAYPSLQSH